MADVFSELLATDAARVKLVAQDIFDCGGRAATAQSAT